MKKYNFAFLFLIFPVLFFGVNTKGDLTIAAGAGYKKVMEKLYDAYKKKTKKEITAVFGNMQQIQTQTKESGVVKIVVGDRSFLSKGKNIQFASYTDLGAGKLVLAYPKGTTIQNVNELTGDTFKKIGMPNTTNAIYGIAAYEYMNSTGLYTQLENKLIQVDTVPQVTSYLVTNEIDAGFINLTDALAMKDSIGGYILIEDGYSKITISAGIVAGNENDPDVLAFIKFLHSPQAVKIIKSYGL